MSDSFANACLLHAGGFHHGLLCCGRHYAVENGDFFRNFVRDSVLFADTVVHSALACDGLVLRYYPIYGDRNAWNYDF